VSTLILGGLIRWIIFATDKTSFCGDSHFLRSDLERWVPLHLPGGVAASAVDGFGLFDDSYQSSDREIGAEALTENLTGLLYGRVATPTREPKVWSTQTLERVMK
jgi:hypothetical protein